MFANKDIAAYYNTTLVHYKQWWNLKKNLSLHYGIWDENTKNFNDSLVNTNRVLMELSAISKTDNVLDAGCGVGGAAMFLAKHKNCSVTGITLSEKQQVFATNTALKNGLNKNVKFMVMDYTNTSFEDESFDVIWACESISSTPTKEIFIKEAYRLLKKGGRLILSDFFITNENQKDDQSWIQKWGDTWAISEFDSSKKFTDTLNKIGFKTVSTTDFTKNIHRSAKRMYLTSILGALPSELYNLFHPNVSKFSKHHYKCGYFQYKALKSKLWEYKVILAVK